MSNSSRGPAAQGSDSEAVRELRAARALAVSGWCKFEHARGPRGLATEPTAADARAWCVSGAIMAAGGEIGDAAYRAFEDAIGASAPGGPISINAWNDEPERTDADVLAAFDRAIALASGASDPKGPSASPSPAPPETP